MALISVESDTQTATGGEDTLTTVSDSGSYVLVVDTSEMIAGDITILRIKTKNQEGEASVLAYSAIYANAQAEPQKYSIPVPVDTEIVCTLEQTDGTNRDYPWNLLRL